MYKIDKIYEINKFIQKYHYYYYYCYYNNNNNDIFYLFIFLVFSHS